MNTTLTSQQICTLTGIHPKQLDRWAAEGVLRPTMVKTGRARGGVRREYTLMDCVAVAVGIRWRDEGAGPERVAGVVKFLSGTSVEWLEGELNAGRTFPVSAAQMKHDWLPGMMIGLDEVDPETPMRVKLLMRRVDAKPIYEKVKQQVEKLAKTVTEKIA